jgi:hypothetical protein
VEAKYQCERCRSERTREDCPWCHDPDNYLRCPICHREYAILSVTNAQWLVCRTCKTKEIWGYNMTDAWKTESPETWEANAKFLEECESIGFHA